MPRWKAENEINTGNNGILMHQYTGMAIQLYNFDVHYRYRNTGARLPESSGRGHAIATGIARMAIKQSKEGELANQRSSKLFGNRRSWYHNGLLYSTTGD